MTVNKYIADQNLEIDVQLRKSIRPAVAVLEEILGSDCVQCGFLLPHFYTSGEFTHKVEWNHDFFFFFHFLNIFFFKDRGGECIQHYYWPVWKMSK